MSFIGGCASAVLIGYLATVKNNKMKRILVLLLTIVVCSSYAQEMFDLFYLDDNFSEEALLDLRYLNEDEAGENGFITQSPDGEGFVNSTDGS